MDINTDQETNFPRLVHRSCPSQRFPHGKPIMTSTWHLKSNERNTRHMLCETEKPPTNVDSAPIEAHHGNVEARTLVSNAVGCWHSTVLKVDHSCRLTVPTHLQNENRTNCMLCENSSLVHYKQQLQGIRFLVYELVWDKSSKSSTAILQYYSRYQQTDFSQVEVV